MDINSDDKNIVEVADRAGIAIPAPCYRANKAKGCCYSCVVEINGDKRYACATKPLDGMKIIIQRADLREIEKENIKKYRTEMKSANRGCDCSCSGDSGGCG